MLTVLIDGYSLADGSQRRGISTYLREFIRGLAANQTVQPLILATPGAAAPPAATISVERR